MAATSALNNTFVCPHVEVGDVLGVEPILTLGEHFGSERLEVGQVAHRVLDRPTLGGGRRRPLSVPQCLEELVQVLLLRDQV